MGPEREEMESKEARTQEHPMLSERFLDMLTEQLKLKESQKKAVETVIDASREPLKKKFDEMRDIQKKARELEGQLRTLTQDMRGKIRAGLDNEQKERFDDIMAQMRKPRRPAGKPPLGPKGLEQEERPQFPPERWEDDPDRGRRPNAEQSEP
jgi:chromosome segregation ATPase